MNHLVFGESAAGSLKYAFRKDGQQQVMTFPGILSVGPVSALHEEAGIEKRAEWLMNHLQDEFRESSDYVSHCMNFIRKVRAIPDGAPVTIWAGENAHEQTGLRFGVYLLKEKQTDIYWINASEAYEKMFNTELLQYDLLHAGEITPEKFTRLYESESAHLLNMRERKALEDEWIALSERDEVLRLWKDGHIQSLPEDTLDESIVERARIFEEERGDSEFYVAPRIIGEVLGHLNQYVGDGFLEYRLRSLIEKGVFQMEGNLKAMRFYSVRLSGKR